MAEGERKPRYTLRPVTTPVAGADEKLQRGLQQPPKGKAKGTLESKAADTPTGTDPFLRPTTEDDDGYDPYSDRPADPEPTFQEHPWR